MGNQYLQNLTNYKSFPLKQSIEAERKSNMQQTYQDKYIAILLTDVKNSQRDLYPLTKNTPLPLLPIGNKKIIVYQLQALNKIKTVQIQRIVVVVSQISQIQNYIQKSFLHQFPKFSKKISFFTAPDSMNNFAKLQNALKYVTQKISDSFKGYLISSSDTIFSFNLQTLIEFHEDKKSDATLLLKPKKQFSQNDKKIPQSQIQTEVDNVLIGQGNEVLFMDMIDQYQHNGVILPPSIYKRVKKSSFKKVVDSKLYIFNLNTVKIIKNLSQSQILSVKPWLIQTLIQHQTNKKLLQLNQGKGSTIVQPLNLYGYLTDSQQFIKRINSRKLYEALNFDSLIRGAKQKDILLPTQFSLNSDSNQFKGCLIIKSSIIGQDAKVTRSCIENNCKIGKKVQILRCILMGNVQIGDDCKLSDSIIGDHSVIGPGCVIKSSYFSSDCRIPDNAKIDCENIISQN